MLAVTIGQLAHWAENDTALLLESREHKGFVVQHLGKLHRLQDHSFLFVSGSRDFSVLLALNLIRQSLVSGNACSKRVEFYGEPPNPAFMLRELRLEKPDEVWQQFEKEC
jgi:hypothetical protein